MSARPWATVDRPGARRPSPPSLTTTATVRLQDEWTGAGSVLVLEGMWWTATVTVNGHALAPVTGGIAPVEVPVGPHLTPGENTLSLEVTRPQNLSALEGGGGLASTGFEWDSPTLQSPPVLRLRPAAYVSKIAVPMTADSVQPSVQVTAAPAGAHVQFALVLDGEQLATLGTAPVVDGRAQLPPTSWPISTWSPDDPTLVHIVATLRDSAGTTLDQASARTGARDASLHDARLHLNGAPYTMVAARVTNKPGEGSFADRLRPWLAGGVNAVELHGELARQAWLDDADELGLPIVLLPRCIGRSNKYSSLGSAVDALMRDQDTRLVDSLRRHPAPLVWMTEGPPLKNTTVSLWTEELLADPHARPVVGHHLPGRVLAIERNGTKPHSCASGWCKDAWIAEITLRGGAGPGMWAQMAEAWQSTFSQGAVGGTIPTPMPRETEDWAQTWTTTSEKLGVTPLPTSKRRAMSEVHITGATPNSVVWLDVPGLTPVGGVADANGSVNLESWHNGAAIVHANGHTLPVTLTAGQWAALTEQPAPLILDLKDL